MYNTVRNVPPPMEGIAVIDTNMKNTALLAGSVMQFWSCFFGNRRFSKDQEFYVVYTSLDHAIPFQPESAINYWLINFRFLPAAGKLGSILPDERFREIRQAYKEIVGQGVAAFRQAPTIMPVFAGRGNAASFAARALMKPINCSPSLHTAAPFFIYNLGARYLPEDEPALRRHVGDLVSTVIQTKFHAMIDVAFGLFLVRKIIEDKLGLDFHDLEDFFVLEQKKKDGIPYEHIFRMYREICEFDKTGGLSSAPLPELMEGYFREIGLPRVRREKSNCLYDLGGKALAYPDALKVGWGLV